MKLTDARVGMQLQVVDAAKSNRMLVQGQIVKVVAVAKRGAGFADQRGHEQGIAVEGQRGVLYKASRFDVVNPAGLGAGQTGQVAHDVLATDAPTPEPEPSLGDA